MDEQQPEPTDGPLEVAFGIALDGPPQSGSTRTSNPLSTTPKDIRQSIWGFKKWSDYSTAPNTDQCINASLS